MYVRGHLLAEPDAIDNLRYEESTMVYLRGRETMKTGICRAFLATDGDELLNIIHNDHEGEDLGELSDRVERHSYVLPTKNA